MGKMLGRTDRIRLLPDPAIRMTPIAPHEAECELAALGLPATSRRVAICMRDFTSPPAFHAAHYSATFDSRQVESMIRALANVCTEVVDRHGAEVVFLPMNTEPPDDDRIPARQVCGAVDSQVRRRLHVVEKQYGPREMKGILGRMDAVLGIRFHSLVLSSSMGVPAYAIEYAPKNSAIMQFFGRGDCMCAMNALEGADMSRKFHDILSNPAPQREALAMRLREINALYKTECGDIVQRIQFRKSGKSCEKESANP
jgi:polysaccharide pyruvyl transferase WcaK-like protein